MVKVEVTVVDAEKKKHSVYTTLGGVKVEWGLQGFSNIRKIRNKINQNFKFTSQARLRHRRFKQWVRKLGFVKKTIKIRRFPQNPPPLNICIPFYHQPTDILANLTVNVVIDPKLKVLRGVKKGRDSPVVPGWLIELNPQLYKDIAHIKWCLYFIEVGNNIEASIKMLHFIISERLGIDIHAHDICRILRMIPHGEPQGLSFPHFMFAMANPTVAREKRIFHRIIRGGQCDIWKETRPSSVQECHARRKTEKQKYLKSQEKAKEEAEAVALAGNSENLAAQDDPAGAEASAVAEGRKVSSESRKETNDTRKVSDSASMKVQAAAEAETRKGSNDPSIRAAPAEETRKESMALSKTGSVASIPAPPQKPGPQEQTLQPSLVQNPPEGAPTSSPAPPGPGPEPYRNSFQPPHLPERIKFRPRPGKKIKFRRPCLSWHPSDTESVSESDKDANKHPDDSPTNENAADAAANQKASRKMSQIKPDYEDKLRPDLRTKPTRQSVQNAKPPEAETEKDKVPKDPPPPPKAKEEAKKVEEKKSAKSGGFWSRMTSGWSSKKEEEEVVEEEEEEEEVEERMHGRRRRSITTTLRLRLRQGNPVVPAPPLGRGSRRKSKAEKSKATLTQRKRRLRKSAKSVAPGDTPGDAGKPSAQGKAKEKHKSKKKKLQRFGPSFEEAFQDYGKGAPEMPLFGRRMSDLGQAERLRSLQADEAWKLEVRRAVHPDRYPQTPPERSKQPTNFEAKTPSSGYLAGATLEGDNPASTNDSKDDESHVAPAGPKTFQQARLGEKFTTIHGEVVVKDARDTIHGLPAEQFWDLGPRDREKQFKFFKKSEKKRIEKELRDKRDADDAAAAAAYLTKAHMRSLGGPALFQDKDKDKGGKPAAGPVKPDMTVPPFTALPKEELQVEQEYTRTLKLSRIQPWSSLVATIQWYSGARGLSYAKAKTITKEAEVIISESHRDFMAVWGSMPLEGKDEFFAKYLKQKKKEMAKYLKDKEEEAKRKAEEEAKRKAEKGKFSLFKKNKKKAAAEAAEAAAAAATAVTAETVAIAIAVAEEDKKKRRHHRRHHHHHHKKDAEDKDKVATETGLDTADPAAAAAKPEVGDTGTGTKKPPPGNHGNDYSESSEGEVEVPKKFHKYELLTPALRHRMFLRRYNERKNEHKTKMAEETKIYEEFKKKREKEVAERKAAAKAAKLRELHGDKHPNHEKYQKMLKAREAAERAQKEEDEAARRAKQWEPEILKPAVAPKPAPPKVHREPMLKRRKIPMGGYLQDSSGYTHREKIFYTGLLMFQMYETMRKFDKTYREAYLAESMVAKRLHSQVQNFEIGTKKKGFAEWDNVPPTKPKFNPYDEPQAFVTTRARRIVPNIRERAHYRSKTQMMAQHNLILPEEFAGGSKRKLKIKENRFRIKQCLKILAENEDDCVSRLPDIDYIIHMSDPAIDVLDDLIQNPTVRRKKPQFYHSRVMAWLMAAGQRLYQPFDLARRIPQVEDKNAVSLHFARHLRKIQEELQRRDFQRTMVLRNKFRRTLWSYTKPNRIPEGRLRDSYIYAFVTLFPAKPTLTIDHHNPNYVG